MDRAPPPPPISYNDGYNGTNMNTFEPSRGGAPQNALTRASKRLSGAILGHNVQADYERMQRSPRASGDKGGTSKCVIFVLILQFILLLAAFGLIGYLMANQSKPAVEKNPALQGAEPDLTLSPEAQALITEADNGANITPAQVLALDSEEQFQVLLHLASRANQVNEQQLDRVKDALRYQGKDIVVDWASQATPGGSLQPIAPTEPIYVGDRLVFRYDANRDVTRFMDKAAFDSCDFTEAAEVLGDPFAGQSAAGVRITLDKAGDYYFTSSQNKDEPESSHCLKGLKLTFTAGLAPDTEKTLVGEAALGGGGGGGGDPFTKLELAEVRGIVEALTRHLVVESMAREQRNRGQGNSGLSRVRGYSGGTEPYHYGSFAQSAIANIHNHANNNGTVGMGELHAVLNGVEFWTRHNDYRLNMPSRTKKDYHAYERIGWPELPTEVVMCGTDVACQINEMREYFRAFQEDDDTIRDYKPYFKPVLAYLEGAWISDTGDLEEPFASDRHQINADTWRELQDRVRFLLSSGRKDNLENLPFLPSSVRDINEENLPVIGNFEYRIMCHPITKDVDKRRFRVASDLHIQLRSNTPLTREQLSLTRRARFEMHPRLSTAGGDPATVFKNWPGTVSREFIDEIMEEVPGKDNYPGNLTDDAFNIISTKYDAGSETLNTAYYSRYYQLNEKDAMGRNLRRRSFSDPTLWAAMTEQEKVIPLTVYDNEGNKYVQRWTWAIPLEILYLTPLGSWNPYNLPYTDDVTFPEMGGRDGSTTDIAKAYNGIGPKHYYMTPASFFTGADGETDPADTSANVVGVDDGAGNLRQCVGSGQWIHLLNITGVGVVRTRYPIMPIHEMGSMIYQEVKSMQAVLTGGGNLEDVRGDSFGITLLLQGGGSGHSHEIPLTPNDLTDMQAGASITTSSTYADGHVHQVKVKIVNSQYVLEQCDGMASVCPTDGHDTVSYTVI